MQTPVPPADKALTGTRSALAQAVRANAEFLIRQAQASSLAATRALATLSPADTDAHLNADWPLPAGREGGAL